MRQNAFIVLKKKKRKKKNVTLPHCIGVYNIGARMAYGTELNMHEGIYCTGQRAAITQAICTGLYILYRKYRKKYYIYLNNNNKNVAAV